MAEKCEFGDTKSERIRDRLISGMSNKQLARKIQIQALDTDITLERVIAMMRSCDLVDEVKQDVDGVAPSVPQHDVDGAQRSVPQHQRSAPQQQDQRPQLRERGGGGTAPADVPAEPAAPAVPASLPAASTVASTAVSPVS